MSVLCNKQVNRSVLFAYRAIFELLPRLWNLSQPSPAHSLAARRVEQVEVVSVPDAGDLAKDAPVADEGRPHKGGTGDSAEVIGVQLQGPETREGEEDHGRPLLGRSEVLFGIAYRVDPRNGLLGGWFIAAGFLAGA